MHREHIRRVRELFEAALQVPPAERSEWVRAACEGDESLAAEVCGLLKAHEAPSPLLRTEAMPGFGAAVNAGDITVEPGKGVR